MSVSTPTITSPDSITNLNQVDDSTILSSQRLLGPNWNAGIDITTRFITRTMFSANHKPVTRLLSTRPVRTISYDVLEGGYLDGIRRYNDELLRSLTKWVEPLWPDAMRVSPLSVGNTSASPASGEGEFTDRRFFVGQLVLVMEFGSKTQFEYAVVSSVGGSSIGFSALTISYSDPYIIPCIVSKMSPSGNLGFLTGNIPKTRVSRTEVLDEYTLPSLEVPGNAPSGFQTHNSVPILDPRHDWGSALDISFERPSETTGLGISEFTKPKTNRPLRRWSLFFRFSDRGSAAAIQRFLDSRGGSVYPFWLLEPTDDLVFFQAGDNTLVVGPSVTFGNAEDSGLEKIDFLVRRYVYWINPANGTIYIRKIVSAVKSVGIWFLTLDGSALPFSDNLNSRVGFASFCRLQSEYTESWTTDRHGDIKVQCEEIEDQADLEVDDFDAQTGTPFDIQWDTNACTILKECRSVFRCDDCCISETSLAIATISITRVSCLDGSDVVSGTSTITAIGIATFNPGNPVALLHTREFGGISVGNFNAIITIQSTGTWPTSNDGVYRAELEARLEGCDIPEIRRLYLDSGTITGGTFTVTVLGNTTAPVPFNATADDLRAAILEADDSLVIEVTGGPLGEQDFLLYVWGEGNISSGNISINGSGLTGSSIVVDNSTEQNGEENDFRRIFVRMRNDTGFPDITAFIRSDPAPGDPYGAIEFIPDLFPFDNFSLDCAGGAGAGTDSVCLGNANESWAFTLDIIQ